MHGQALIQRLVPQILRELVVQRLQHLLNDVLGAVIATVEVRGGEEIAFQGRGWPQAAQEGEVEIKVAGHGRFEELLPRDNALLVESVGDLLQTPALDHGDKQRRDDAAAHAVDGLQGRGVLVKLVLPGLEHAVIAQQLRQNAELDGGVDDPLLLQRFCDVLDGLILSHGDGNGLRRRSGRRGDRRGRDLVHEVRGARDDPGSGGGHCQHGDNGEDGEETHVLAGVPPALAIEKGLKDDGRGQGIDIAAAAPRAGRATIAGQATPGLGGGEAFVPGVDGDIEALGEGVGQGPGALGLGPQGTAEGEGQADDDGFGALLLGNASHGLHGVAARLDGRQGNGHAGVEVGSGDADALFAGVYGQDASAAGLRRHSTPC